jgi:hypothetical protein
VANALFTSFRNGILGAHATRVDLDADTISIMFVDHLDDTPVAATDDFLNDIASAARVPALASVPSLASKTIGTVAAGVFDAADTVFTALTGDQSESLIMFKNTGTDTTCDLIAFWDTATGLPLTPNGGDVTVAWNASGILQV